jgi:hypothetical protein
MSFESGWIAFVVLGSMLIGALAARVYFLREVQRLVNEEWARYVAELQKEIAMREEFNYRVGHARGAEEMARHAVLVGLRVN